MRVSYASLTFHFSRNKTFLFDVAVHGPWTESVPSEPFRGSFWVRHHLDVDGDVDIDDVDIDVDVNERQWE
jgi:hypothetical protein